jgi:hypothetical protein
VATVLEVDELLRREIDWENHKNTEFCECQRRLREEQDSLESAKLEKSANERTFETVCVRIQEMEKEKELEKIKQQNREIAAPILKNEAPEWNAIQELQPTYAPKARTEAKLSTVEKAISDATDLLQVPRQKRSWRLGRTDRRRMKRSASSGLRSTGMKKMA